MNTEMIVRESEPENGNMVDGRDLYRTLEVAKDYTDWMKYQIDRFQLVEDEDFRVLPNIGVNPLGGRPGATYSLTLNAAKRIALGQNSSAAKLAHAALIKIENAWNSEDMVIARALQIAGRKLVRQESQIKLLFQESEEKSKVIEEQKPMVESFKRLLDSTGTYNLDVVAKKFGWPPHSFNQRLKESGWIFQRKIWDRKEKKEKNGPWVACSDKVQAGFLVEQPYEDPVSKHSGLQVRVTAKGLDRLCMQFGGGYELR